jgi:hypothetical protein
LRTADVVMWRDVDLEVADSSHDDVVRRGAVGCVERRYWFDALLWRMWILDYLVE